MSTWRRWPGTLQWKIRRSLAVWPPCISSAHRENVDHWRLLEGHARRAAYMLADGIRPKCAWNKVADRMGSPKKRRRALKQAYKILFRDGLTIPNASTKLKRTAGPSPNCAIWSNSSAKERGISK